MPTPDLEIRSNPAGDGRVPAGKLAAMRTNEQRAGAGRGPCDGARSRAASPVQSFLFGHSRAEVVYDCR